VSPLDPSAFGDYYARPGWVAVDRNGDPIPKQSCLAERTEIWQGLIDHIRKDSTHQETVKLIQWVVTEWNSKGKRPLDIGSADIFLAQQIAFNETMVFSNVVGSEIGLVANAAPEYYMFASSQQSTSNVQNVGQWMKSAVSFVVKGFQSVKQWFQTHAEGPATYYKVTLYAPFIYGLVQMVLLALFPVAAIWGLWPGHWKVLLNFGKLFVSVKLWVVFWAALAAFNQGRYDLILGNDPARNGAGNAVEIFPSIAAMYLLTPLLSFMIVSLATNCGALVIQGIIPGSATISGLSDLHKEAREMKQDAKDVLDGARTAAQAGANPVGTLGQMANAFQSNGQGSEAAGSASAGAESGGAGGSAAGAPPPV